jgi:uncharacterized protein with PQ loop repeat
MLLFVFGWSLAVATIVTELIQLMRSSKVKSSAGLSALTMCATVLVFSWWLIYSMRLQVWPGVAADLLAVVLAGSHAFASKMLRVRHVTAVVALVAAGVILPITILGIAATSISAARGIPQLRAAWHAADLSGVSVKYWVLQAVTGIGWLVFGLASGAPWLGAFAVVAAPVSLGIAWHASRTQVQHQHPALAVR